MNSDIPPLTIKSSAPFSSYHVVVVVVAHIGLLLWLMLCCSVICCGWGTVSYLLSLSLKSWIIHLLSSKYKGGEIPKLDELHVFPVHLLSQHPVGIFKAQHSQSQLIFSHSPGVTRLFGGKIIFSVIFFSSLTFYFFSHRIILTHLRRSQYLSSFLAPGPGEARPVSWWPP